VPNENLKRRVPPIPQPQLGGGRSRFDIFLENFVSDIKEDPLGNAELLSSPIPVVGDVLGTAAGVQRFAKDPSVEEALFTALGIAPFVSGAMIKDLVGPRLKQLVKELNASGDEARTILGQDTKLATALTGVDDAQSLRRAADNPATPELTRARIKRKLKEIELEDPFTGELTNAGDLTSQELLDLRTQLRGKDRALQMKRKIVEKEFERLQELGQNLQGKQN